MSITVETRGAVRARTVYGRGGIRTTNGTLADVQNVLVFNDEDAARNHVAGHIRDGVERRTYHRIVKVGGLAVHTWVVIERERGRVDVG